MPKRKSSDREEKIKKKIRKLERRLARRHRRSSSSNSSSDGNLKTDEENSYIDNESVALGEPSQITEMEISPDVGIVLPDNEVTTQEVEISLEDSVLSALGEATNMEKMYGEEIHQEIYKRIENILTDGLSTEQKEVLIKKYLIPSNAKLLDAPTLNLELESSLSETIKSRDKRVEERQQHLGIALSAITRVIDDIIKKNYDSLKVITTLSDVARLLSELHFQDTCTRRKLIYPSLNKDLTQTSQMIKRDKFLFGKNFQETIKSSNAIKKSAASVLKQNSTVSESRKAPIRKSGNFRAPPRSSQLRSYKQGRGAKYQQYQQRSSARSRQRQPPARQFPQKPVRQT